MDEMNKMQTLHLRSVKGESLTANEQTDLQNWYQCLDREEDSVLNNSQPIQNSTDLRENLADTTRQVAKISREIESLIEQNSNVRSENQSLKKALESRLLEKVA